MPPVNGREIRQRRQRLGIKLGPFAALARVGYKTLANMESKPGYPVSIEVLHRIADSLGNGTKAEDLIEDEDEPEAVAAA